MPMVPGPGGGLVKGAVKSDDYVSRILARQEGGGPTLTKDQKVAHLRMILADQVNGLLRLGVGMVGPIQLKLRYQGIVRNVLMEDPIQPGTPVEYDVWDDLGQAYIMSPVGSEVRVTPFEAKRIPVNFFRISSRPAVRKEDLYASRIDVVEQAQDETKQSIMKQEDAYLMILLQAALTDYATRADHDITPHHTVIEGSGYYTPQSFYTAVAQTSMHELRSTRLLVNEYDYRDFFRWPTETTGWAFKDRTVAGEQITSFGEFQIQRSVMVPQGKIFLTPDPEFLGVMPILYSLDVEVDNRVESFWRGWVFDEMINELILNPRGIAAITKA